MIYRRIDDDFLDPQAFRADSMLGVPGLMDAYRAGRVALANAPGTGIADDKVVYAYVPRDHQVLPGRGRDHPERADVSSAATTTQRKHVLANLDKLVVKPANESGGYGMLIGPRVDRGRARRVRRADQGQPAQLHRPADAEPVARAGARRRRPRRPARRSAAVHPLRPATSSCCPAG